MTMSQKLLGIKIKPLTISLTSILFTSISLVSLTTPSHAEPVNANVAINAPSSSPSTPPAPSTTDAIITAPTTTTTPGVSTEVRTTSPATTASQITTPAVKPVIKTTAPLDQANMTDNDLLSWATDAAQLAYTYDFKNYPKQMVMLQDHFTPEGWKAFTNALDKSNNLNVVQNKKLVASASPTGSATLLKEGVKNGLYTWKVQIPLVATYESESRLIKQNLLVTLLISRAPNNSKGVGITHFVANITPAATTPVSNTNTITDSTSITTPGTTIQTPTTTQPQTSTPSTNIYNQVTPPGAVTPPNTTGTPSAVNPPNTTGSSTIITNPAATTTSPANTTVTNPNPPTMGTTPSTTTTTIPSSTRTPSY